MREKGKKESEVDSPTLGERKELFFENNPWIPSLLKLVSFFLYGLIALMLSLSVFLKSTGISTMTVVSNSMVPTFERGDLILVEKNPQSYTPGDIAVYYQESHDRDVVHRIVQIDGDQVTVKGDNNYVADPTFSKSALKGAVVGIAPNLGFLYFRLNLMIIVGIAAILGIFTDGWKIRFRRRQLGRHEHAHFVKLQQEENKK